MQTEVLFRPVFPKTFRPPAPGLARPSDSIAKAGVSERKVVRNGLRPRRGKIGDRIGGSREFLEHETLRAEAVTTQGLQSAVLLVLGLYASLGLLNLATEFSSIAQLWHGLIEFLAHLFF